VVDADINVQGIATLNTAYQSVNVTRFWLYQLRMPIFYHSFRFDAD